MVELSPQYRCIDELLQRMEITKEILEIDNAVYAAKKGDTREAALKKPPRFKFISEFHAALYDLTDRKVYEGEWSDLHSYVAAVHDLNLRNKQYISADVFVLRAQPQSRILRLYTVFGMHPIDIAAMATKYLVMNQERNWVILDEQSGLGFTLVPSALGK